MSQPPDFRGPGLSRGSLVIIFLTVFIDLLGFGIILPLLPLYADYYVADSTGMLIGLLMASFSLAQFLFLPVWGRLSDRFGRRPVLLIGLAGSVVFYVLFGVATVVHSVPLMFAARIGAGIAGATVATAHAYIADSTSLEHRARGMALIGAAFGAGFTLGPLLGMLAVPSGHGDPGPWAGFAAAGLSAIALGLALFLLPESLPTAARRAGAKARGHTGRRQALTLPSIGLLLFATFLCVFSFANFETTLSLLIKGQQALGNASPFRFDFREVCLTYACIGFTAAFVQGVLVRRLAAFIAEGRLAAAGAAIQIVGFGLLVLAIGRASPALLFAALPVVVTGYAFMQPNLNALLSRRTDPLRQGAVLGIGQSVNALARITGYAVGIPLLKQGLGVPYLGAAGVMAIGLVMVVVAARAGKDFSAPGG